MDDEKTGTVDPEMRSAVAEALKTIPHFEAHMAEAAKRLTEANQKNCEEDKEGDKDKDGDNNKTKDSKLVLFAIVSMPSFVAGADIGLPSHPPVPSKL